MHRAKPEGTAGLSRYRSYARQPSPLRWTGQCSHVCSECWCTELKACRPREMRSTEGPVPEPPAGQWLSYRSRCASDDQHHRWSICSITHPNLRERPTAAQLHDPSRTLARCSSTQRSKCHPRPVGAAHQTRTTVGRNRHPVARRPATDRVSTYRRPPGRRRHSARIVAIAMAGRPNSLAIIPPPWCVSSREPLIACCRAVRRSRSPDARVDADIQPGCLAGGDRDRLRQVFAGVDAATLQFDPIGAG
jgi:hypothetical protein